MKKVVILMPAHNEESHIRETIDALLKQTYKPEKIIIVPNGCTDDTAKIAKTFPVEVYELPLLKHGKAEALNKAWKKYSTGMDIVICVDADCLAPSNLVKSFVLQLTSGHDLKRPVVAVTGSVTIPEKEDNIGASLQYYAQMNIRRLNLIGGNAKVLLGNCSGFLQSALIEVSNLIKQEGPWDYNSETEDHKLTYDLRKLGYTSVTDPDIFVTTFPKADPGSTFQQMLRWHIGASKNLLRMGLTKNTLDAYLVWWLPEVITSMARFIWLLALIAGLLLRPGLTWWVYLALVWFGLFLYEFYSLPFIRARNRSDRIFRSSVVFLEISTWAKSIMIITAVSIAIFDLFTGNGRNRWHEQNLTK